MLRVITGVAAKRPGANLQELRMQADAQFPQINNEVAESYAGNENARSELRTIKTLTFTISSNARIGTATLTDDVLRKYLKDATLYTGTGQNLPPTKYGYRPEWDDFLRQNDRRLGSWSTNGGTIGATKPNTMTGLTGSASLVCICSPPIPATADDEFDAPADYIPDFVDAFILWFLSNASMDAAAQAT